MTTEEQDTLNRARNFDVDVLAAIYDRYSPGIYRYALRLLGDAAQAEDCTAETFSRFLSALKNGGGPADHLQAYLYRIAHNWVTDFYRRTPVNLELSETLYDHHSDAVEQVEDKIEYDEIRLALMCLTPDQRQVVLLKFMEGWDYEEIAEALQKQVSAVRALQHRALETLRRVLPPEEIKNVER